MGEEAVAHATLALRLSPKDYWAGTAHLAMTLAYFALRNYTEAIRWCESAIQVSHRAPIRRALMIACSAQAGDIARAQTEIVVLNSFAPGFSLQVSWRKSRFYSRRRHEAPFGWLRSSRTFREGLTSPDFRVWHETEWRPVGVMSVPGAKAAVVRLLADVAL
jgi:tetratricopeptide (TPR) repeat protein